MKNCCASCSDAIFYSEGTRLNPLNYFSACRYLTDNEETDKMYLDENERYSLASDLAADICSINESNLTPKQKTKKYQINNHEIVVNSYFVGTKKLEDLIVEMAKEKLLAE